jgi:hypothetical protein
MSGFFMFGAKEKAKEVRSKKLSMAMHFYFFGVVVPSVAAHYSTVRNLSSGWRFLLLLY